MIKLYIFSQNNFEVKMFQSVDQAQNHIDSLRGQYGFRVFQVNGKKQKKELKDGFRK